MEEEEEEEVAVLSSFGSAPTSGLPPEGGGRRMTRPDPKSCTGGPQEGASTVGGQLGLNVHSADGALPAGGQPLVHTPLVEEVHAG